MSDSTNEILNEKKQSDFRCLVIVVSFGKNQQTQRFLHNPAKSYQDC